MNLNDEDVQGISPAATPDLLKQLVVEITEQEDLDRACLERKRNIPGFSGAFALDDYGTGYSNELNLLELSPRYIKIDISIIRGIEKDPDKQQIVSNIVAYAHARSMQILAEGIEMRSSCARSSTWAWTCCRLLPQPPGSRALPHRIRSAGCRPRCQRAHSDAG